MLTVVYFYISDTIRCRYSVTHLLRVVIAPDKEIFTLYLFAMMAKPISASCHLGFFDIKVVPCTRMMMMMMNRMMFCRF